MKLAQEGAERGRCHHPVAEDLVGRGAAQDVGIVDEVPTGDHRVHQGHHLAPRKEVARAPTQVDAVVDHGFEAQVLGQRCGQHQASRGNRVVIVEGDCESVEAVRCLHREGAPILGSENEAANHILPGRSTFSADAKPVSPSYLRWFQA